MWSERRRRDAVLRPGEHRGCAQGALVLGCRRRCHSPLAFHAGASPGRIELPWIKGFGDKLLAAGGFACPAHGSHPACTQHLETPQRWDLFFLLSRCDSHFKERRSGRACVAGDVAAVPCSAPQACQPPFNYFIFYYLLGAINSFATFSSAIYQPPPECLLHPSSLPHWGPPTPIPSPGDLLPAGVVALRARDGYVPHWHPCCRLCALSVQ